MTQKYKKYALKIRIDELHTHISACPKAADKNALPVYVFSALSKGVKSYVIFLNRTGFQKNNFFFGKNNHMLDGYSGGSRGECCPPRIPETDRDVF